MVHTYIVTRRSLLFNERYFNQLATDGQVVLSPLSDLHRVQYRSDLVENNVNNRYNMMDIV